MVDTNNLKLNSDCGNGHGRCAKLMGGGVTFLGKVMKEKYFCNLDPTIQKNQFSEIISKNLFFSL